MRFYYTIILVCLVISNISAQVETTFSAGIGVKYNMFISSIPTPLESINDFSSHLNLQMEVKRHKKSGFNGMVQLNLLPKKISFGTTSQSQNGGRIIEGFTHEFLSAELLLAASFDIPIKQFIIQPKLGFCFAFNQYNGANHFTRTSGSSASNHQASNWVFETETEPFFIYPSIVIGGTLKRNFFKKNRVFSLFFDSYITPRDIFTSPFFYQINGDDFELKGKYHYVILGLRVEIF